jgi:hypothetical protein
MSRMVGGTFGVAVMGALISTIGRSHIDSSLPHVSAATRARLADSLGAGGATAGHHAPLAVVSAVREAFVSALGSGLMIGAIVTFCGAIAAWLLIEPKLAAAGPQAAPVEQAPEPVEAAEALI